MNRTLIVANTYYQLIIAIQMSNTIFSDRAITLLLSDHSVNAKKICDNLNTCNVFDRISYICSKDIIYSERTLSDRVKNYIDLTFKDKNRWGFMLDDIREDGNLYFDEMICFNFGTDTYGMFSILSRYNRKIIVSLFEEGALSYGVTAEITFGRRMINSSRRILGKRTIVENMKYFYCYHPEIYNGDLEVVGVPQISKGSECAEILSDVFDLNNREYDYSYKYIFFTSVYDFEGGEPIGEYEIVEKIAKTVGKDNVLIKTHPRDRRNVYIDNGFNVDCNSDIPWEVIQLSGDFSDKVFLTATSGSVLAGSFMSDKPVRTIYLYKLCNLSRNTSAQKSAKDILDLTKNSKLKSVLNSVSIAERIEDIL